MRTLPLKPPEEGVAMAAITLPLVFAIASG